MNKVESVIKGSVVAQPGPRTIIIGKNGIGKSAIVNSIEAAGTGRVSDVAGRALLARDADLFMLAPPEAERVWSVAKLSDNSACEWSIDKGHKAKRTGPEIAFPLRDAREAILGSPETARKWILRNGAEIEWYRDVIPLIPESLRPLLKTRFDQVAGDGSYALTAALETARQRVRELNAIVKAQRTITAPPQPPPTDADLAQLEGVIQTWKSQAGRAGALAQLDSLRAQLASAKLAVETHATRLGSVTAELQGLPPAAGNEELFRAAVLVCEAMAKAQATSCAICGGKANPTDLSARAQRARERINAAEALAHRRADLIFAGREADNDLGVARRELARIEALTVEAEKLAQVGEAKLPDVDEKTATVRLASLRAVRAGWEASRRAEEAALQAEREATEWDQLADALGKALGVLVEKARVGFEGRVQKFLPRADLFGVDLLDGDREVLRIGLRRLHGDRMQLHPALSGAEWARVTAALALATAPSEGPCVIVPEERAFDAETLADVLAAFDEGTKAVGESAPQVIVTSPVRPARVPAGWTVIDLAKRDEETGEPATSVKRKSKKSEPEPGEVRAEFEVVDGKMVEKKNGKKAEDPLDIFR